MITTAKVTSKGQVTIPKEIRDMLKTDVVEIRPVKGNVIIKPVMSVGGSLQKYAKKYYPLKDIRNSVWEDVVNDKAKKTLKNKIIPERAEGLDFSELEPFTVDTPVVVFFFIPYILETGILDIVKECKLPESSVIGSIQACTRKLEHLKIWFVSHIQGTDRGYIDCFKKHGLK